MGEIWGRNGRETAVAEWRWGQERGNIREAYCRRILGEDAEVAATAAEQLYTYE